MKSTSQCLKELASVIGWSPVNEDKGFCIFEYEVHVSKHENDLFIVRILDEPNELETRELLSAILKVLPYKLRKKTNKLLSKFKMEDFSNLTEVVSFTIDEYRKSTEFAKLQEYGRLLGVKIDELGYKFEYKLKKNTRSEILSQIEIKLPMEIAPVLGKIRKLDYKIAYIKNNRIKADENE